MHVILCKSSEAKDEYVEAIEAAGHSTQIINPLEFLFTGKTELERELENPYDALIVTSGRAVDVLSKANKKLSEFSWTKKPVLAVGPTTAKRLQTLGFGKVWGGAEAGSAKKLVAVLEAKLNDPENVGCSSFLFVCGEPHSSDIPNFFTGRPQCSLKSVTVYCSAVSPTFQPSLMTALETWVSRPSASGLTVGIFSPLCAASSLQVLQKFFGGRPKLTPPSLACIGPTTSRALGENCPFPRTVACLPTPRHFAALIQANDLPN